MIDLAWLKGKYVCVYWDHPVTGKPEGGCGIVIATHYSPDGEKVEIEVDYGYGFPYDPEKGGIEIFPNEEAMIRHLRARRGEAHDQ